MKPRTYLKYFATADDATAHMIRKNRAARDGTLYCLVDGPDENYAVVDLRTATDFGVPYEWRR